MNKIATKKAAMEETTMKETAMNNIPKELKEKMYEEACLRLELLGVREKIRNEFKNTHDLTLQIHKAVDVYFRKAIPNCRIA